MAKTTFVNATQYDHGTAEVTILGHQFPLVKSITYKDKIEIGKARGNSAAVRGTTDGTYDAEGDIEFYPGDVGEGGAVDLLILLGNGWMKRRDIPIVVTRGKDELPLRTDELVSCRILGNDSASSEGNEAHTNKFSLFISKIIKDGIDPIDK